MLRLLFPDTCHSCGSPSGPTYICEGCLERSSLIGARVCELCGRPLLGEPDDPSSVDGGSGGKGKAAAEAPRFCRECETPPSEQEGPFFRRFFTRARSVALYDGLLGEMLRDFKFRVNIAAGEGLSLLLSLRFPGGLDPEPDLIVPVPLHPRKLRERGFNQAVVLGRSLADRLGVSLDPFVLVRKRYTRPQFELFSLRERMENVKGAFFVEGGLGRVRGAKVLLLDDIFTSGATVGECARVILGAGAKGVEVCTLTRSLGSLEADAFSPRT